MTETFYVTKNVLIDGIVEVEGVTCNGVLFVGNRCYYGEGKDWHRTHAGAVARAKAVRDYKIASHKAKLARLEALAF